MITASLIVQSFVPFTLPTPSITPDFCQDPSWYKCYSTVISSPSRYFWTKCFTWWIVISVSEKCWGAEGWYDFLSEIPIHFCHLHFYMMQQWSIANSSSSSLLLTLWITVYNPEWWMITKYFFSSFEGQFTGVKRIHTLKSDEGSNSGFTTFLLSDPVYINQPL